MRILYHHRTLADGAEGVHIAAIVDALRRLGHVVQVDGATMAVTAAHRRRLVERVRKMMPRIVYELVAVLLNVPDYLRTRRAIRTLNADLVYTRHGKFDIAALAAARRLAVPAVLEVNCVFTAAGYERFEPLVLSRVARALERRALRSATVAIAVSTPLAHQVRDVSGRTATVIANGADPNRFDPREVDGEAVRTRLGVAGRFVVGWVGIFREWHGLELMLDAIAKVPDVTALFVGEGPAQHVMERRAAALGIDTRVVLTGRVPHDTMPHYIAAMDVAVVADERTGVASPMKLLEYMAMGKAVIAPGTENIRDLIDEGVDGLLFEPGNASALASAIAALRGDPVRRQQLGREARLKIEQERNWTAIASTIVALAKEGGASERTARR